jgi:hypothetical protein
MNLSIKDTEEIIGGIGIVRFLLKDESNKYKEHSIQIINRVIEILLKANNGKD